MEKQLLIIDSNLLDLDPNTDVEPLDWLASIFRKIKGKTVALDDSMFNFLVNNPYVAGRETATTYDGYEKYYRLEWAKSDDYNEAKGTGNPDLQIIVSSFGDADETPNVQGRIMAINDERNWHYIEEIFAKEPFKGFKVEYSKQSLVNPDLVFIATEKTERVKEKIENYTI